MFFDYWFFFLDMFLNHVCFFSQMFSCVWRVCVLVEIIQSFFSFDIHSRIENNLTYSFCLFLDDEWLFVFIDYKQSWFSTQLSSANHKLNIEQQNKTKNTFDICNHGHNSTPLYCHHWHFLVSFSLSIQWYKSTSKNLNSWQMKSIYTVNLFEFSKKKNSSKYFQFIFIVIVIQEIW